MTQVKEVSPIEFSTKVVTLSRDRKISLLDAMVEACEIYDIPFTDVCNFTTTRLVTRGSLLTNLVTEETIKETFNLVTPSLLGRITEECINNKLLPGKVNSII